MKLLAATFGIFVWFVAAGAAAECSCFCVDGSPHTLCSTLQEAQDQPHLCTDLAMNCPLDRGTAAESSYEAPADGATNCRDARVWDVGAGEYTTVKVCDVENG
ncbi:MAG: hypothetical protein R3E86_07720 [Pseudomonadales bacterium]